MIRRIFLVGMMGAGKSTVGKRVADALGWDFLDTDAMVAESVGMSIPEIFSRKGEAFFREAEKVALARAGERERVVVATGGGAVLAGENWRVMETEGSLSVYLEASVSTLTRQVAGSGERPLLSGGPGKLADILRARKPFYRRASQTIRVDGRTPAEVAAMVIWLLKPDFSEADPGVFVGRGASRRLPDILRERGYARSFLVTDKLVWNAYGQSIAGELKTLGPLSVNILPGGEASKTLAEAQAAWRRLKALAADRQTPVIALGGGSVGDLAGFVASTYMRGLPLIQVPTTLLAMVDSSLGGKNALNMGKVKNLVGTFYFPERVLADTVFILGLDKDSFADGMAEAIKTGLVASRELWEFIRARKESLARRELSALGEMVSLAGRAKLSVVREDPHDRARRHILNFGHTVGHALELSMGLSHGRAVAIGMVAEARMGVRMGITPASLVDDLREALSENGLPTEIPEGFDPRAASALISHDKKAVSGRLVLPVLREPGIVELVDTEPERIFSP